ncbi:N-acetyl-gamma-glutamyl-phosphate reductase [Micromonospora sp. RP3T]|uniref:N-acetyl-gamma-glutamyl-phosphate reductase n=1 Tax=Micromonospora sp. RP3T TaxID=2135446 RepID=UPI001E336D39|nr:N-acetyl-gamma-glutamyl-phosphate reductase [Micromonospora sp. RP3T]
MRATVLGAGGFIGGELVRLLLDHPHLDLAQVTSTRFAGRPVTRTNPNLRGLTDLTFVAHDEIDDCDVLFCAAPHRTAMSVLPGLLGRAKQVVDLSGDFRLRDGDRYRDHYGVAHGAPELLDTFTPAVPELYRDRLRTADRMSVPGCMATAAILGLAPLAEAGLIDGTVLVDARTGSSGSGASASDAGHHPVRSGAMRVFAPAGHRHEAEIAQVVGVPVEMTATGVEAVRGVQVVCRVPLAGRPDDRAVRAVYRDFYRDSPFVRVVAQRTGAVRLPEPKILTGTNRCDVGFALRPDGGRATVVAALDNLVKGGAGAAVQALNVRHGWPETTGLGFPGLFPV